jgi:hypothetical protein
VTTPSPGVPDFIAGYGPQQSDFQSWWVNSAAFFQQRVIFRALQSTTATTLPDSGDAVNIEFDDVLEDPYSGWDSVHHTWTPPAGYSGWYLVTLTVIMAAAPSASSITLSTYVEQNGGVILFPLASTVLAGGSGAATCGNGGAQYVYLTGGQDIVAGKAAIQNAAAGLDTSVTAGQQPAIEIVWISS